GRTGAAEEDGDGIAHPRVLPGNHVCHFNAGGQYLTKLLGLSATPEYQPELCGLSPTKEIPSVQLEDTYEATAVALDGPPSCGLANLAPVCTACQPRDLQLGRHLRDRALRSADEGSRGRSLRHDQLVVTNGNRVGPLYRDHWGGTAV